MPSVTYNSQSFAIDSRRLWILGASIQYARVPAALWEPRIRAAKQAGFNTIETACPWMIHEPRKGRFVFQGDADVRRFVEICGSMGLKVILRAGPYVGSQFDAGGLPGWLIETPDVMVRENNALFLEHVSRYFRKLLGEVSDLQVTTGGPILLVQSEHAWTCSNEVQAAKYLHEVTRFIRESGINVPVINANDLWQESPHTIDTWRGYDDLLAHLRQLRGVQPDAPRLMSAFDPTIAATWGSSNGAKTGKGKSDRVKGPDHSPQTVLRRLAEVLAAGAQPVVSPFHGGTNFGFLGGRLSGSSDRFVTTSAAAGAPLGEAGYRGETYHLIKRLMTFANHFGQVFAELDAEYHPSVLDPSADGAAPIAVPVTGSQGGIVFVFAGKNGGNEPTLILDGGVRLPVHLGKQSVGWYAMNVDLNGSGRLDFANVMPWAIVDRTIVVLHGPAGASAYLSVNGVPLEGTVPAGNTKPLVQKHQGLTIVICNEQQIDAAYHDESSVWVGAGGLDAAGKPLPLASFAKSWVIRKNAVVEELKLNGLEGGGGSSKGSASSGGRTPTLAGWKHADLKAYLTGASPRFASLEGPETLSECGAPTGYGWYRMVFDASGRKLCHLPQAGDRLHVFIDGRVTHRAGVGPGASGKPFELRFAKGTQTLVVLADNFGRFADGNDMGQRRGVWGHLQEVKLLRGGKPKIVNAEPVDPFKLRGFISGRSSDQLSETQQLVWTFEHIRKTPVLIDINGSPVSGTFVLNDEPVAYYAGDTGGCVDHIMLDPKTLDAFKRGKNVLRFAPDIRQDKAVESMMKATALYECVEAVTEKATWGFAKWEPPAPGAFKQLSKGETRPAKGLPCWWSAAFGMPANHSAAHHGPPLWIETTGLSKGQIFVNGENIGRYFTATAEGKPIGPQTLLHVPACWLKAGEGNHVTIFDEHGMDPGKVRLVQRDRGPLD